jgi:signal transduction histidine kinase
MYVSAGFIECRFEDDFKLYWSTIFEVERSYASAVRSHLTMTARDGSTQLGTWLVNLPATPRQRWSALAITAVLLAEFAILAPYAGRQLPRLDAFIPALEATVFVTDLITSVLLYALFSIHRSRPLLVLATGYLFTALIVIPHALTFPGAFSASGLLGAGLQTTAWLWIFWHVGFPAALLCYAMLKVRKDNKSNLSTSPLFSIGASVAIAVGLVCGLTWLTIAGEELLPRLFLDRMRPSPTGHNVAISMILICATATAALWPHRRSVLDQWLMVVGCAWILEMVFTALFTNSRFSVGFYAGRSFSLVTSTIVLAVLLAETTRLYARLARANTMLQRERNNKLMNLEAMLASFSHEMKQPLAAIVTNGGTALRLLARAQPELDEAQSVLRAIVEDGHRASAVIDNLRALFGRMDRPKEPVDVNEVAREALHNLRGDLKDHDVTSRVKLTSELPLVIGHRGQLQEVVINLVHNAIEAMEGAKEEPRLLQVRTEREEGNVVLAVEDSGHGIDSKKLEGIFDPFVTTKQHGTGLGLAICRMIVERHGGQISASLAQPRGSIFRVILPIGTHRGMAAADSSHGKPISVP